jgi:hypothetical protein
VIVTVSAKTAFLTIIATKAKAQMRQSFIKPRSRKDGQNWPRGDATFAARE